MKYIEWIARTKAILLQYDEGAIFAPEALFAIVNAASEVDEPAGIVEDVTISVEPFDPDGGEL